MTVSFIIPTLNRNSLTRTLKSLIQQTDPDWEAIVLGDGCEITNAPYDSRIFNYQLDKQVGGAGIVRNIGLDQVTTDWIAFVDDDDYIKNNYVSRIKFWSKDYDLIQFTYRDVENGNTQPPANLNHLVSCNFGISFAVRTLFIRKNNIKFTPGGIEDFRFLDDCLKAGAKYIITHEILYFVGHRSSWN